MTYNIYFIHGDYEAAPAPRPATIRAQRPALTNVARPTSTGPQRAPQRPPVVSRPQILVQDVAGQSWSPSVIQSPNQSQVLDQTQLLINYLHPIRDVVVHDVKGRPAVVVPVDPDLERL